MKRSSQDLKRRGHERDVNRNNREKVRGVVHWAQRPDDAGRFASHRGAGGGGNRSESIGCVAARFQRRGPSGVFLAHAQRGGGYFGAAPRGFLFLRRGVPI